MKAPFQEGSFNLPIKYGYINVGNIIDGPRKYINKKIFSLYPQQRIKLRQQVLLNQQIPE